MLLFCSEEGRLVGGYSMNIVATTIVQVCCEGSSTAS